MKNKKKFISEISFITLCFTVGRLAAAGILQAIISFFTKKQLEKWEKSREKDEK
jgi:hypothetical protein